MDTTTTEEPLSVRRSGRKRVKKKSFTENESVKGRWTDEEKQLLHESLVKYGYQDIKKIAKHIPTRSEPEVYNAIRYWKLLTVKINEKEKCVDKTKIRKETKSGEEKSTKQEQLAILEAWIEFFQTQSNEHVSEGVYSLSNLFLLIAETEAHPHPSEADGLDFREMYLWLHDMVNGKPMKKLPGVMLKFILDSFKELEFVSENNKMALQAHHINRIINSMKRCPVKTYSKNDEKGSEDRYMDNLLKFEDINPIRLDVSDGIKKTINMTNCK